MYLQPASATGDGGTDGAGRMEGDPRLEARLLARVRAAFPGLAIASTRLELSGGDHVFLVADERWMFRFARTGRRDLEPELAVLARLQRAGGLPTPRYRHVDGDTGIVGYRPIAGLPLTPARFRRLPPGRQRAVVDDVAGFLRRMHGLDPADLQATADWPRLWSPARFAARALDERLPLLAARLPALAPAIEAFLRTPAESHPPETAVVHGDLVPGHVLVDGAGTVAGIIDFADVALGDPAQDLALFWAFGAGAAARAVVRYRGGRADRALLRRARDQFVRQRIDRLFERFAAGRDAASLAHPIAELRILLAPSPVTPSNLPRRSRMEDPNRPADGQPTASAPSGHPASLVSQVRDRAVSAATDGKDGIADRIDALADTVHRSGEQFSGQQDWIASAIERGATELGSLATSLRQNDLSSLVGQVRTIARRQPALFIGACLAGGFALARVGKLVVADASRDDLPALPEISHGER